MLKNPKYLILLYFFTFLLIAPSESFAWHGYAYDGDWNYHGSGRDYPYSAYIDRSNYIGPSDYSYIDPIYIDGPLVLTKAPSTPALAPVPNLSITQTQEYTVNIPNTRGWYNTVVIKRSGDGFVGPQGEYYPEFPKIFQLQMKYGN